MLAGLTLLAYIVAGVFFILTLRGLSNPETSRRGNILGMVGMVIAIATTLFSPVVQTFGLILAGIAVGGIIGAIIARKIQMTALPQLVAAFHSLVGLAAVFVAMAAFFAPEAYNIGVRGAIHTNSLVEMSLGLAIGAVTFSGSVIAFSKLQGLMSGGGVRSATYVPSRGRATVPLNRRMASGCGGASLFQPTAGVCLSRAAESCSIWGIKCSARLVIGL